MSHKTTLKIGVVTSRFNSEITERLESGAIDYLTGINEAVVEILSVRVPGAVEIPLACKALFEAGCDGVVALGAVIRGDTAHFDYVCNSVERGVTELMLREGKPIGFGVLTVDTDEQAEERVGGKHGHKGIEAAQVTYEMIGLLRDLRIQRHVTDLAVLAKVNAEMKASNKASKTSVAKKGKKTRKSR